MIICVQFCFIYWIQCLTSWSGERPWHCTVGFDPQPVIGPSLHLQPDFAKTLNPFMPWPYMLNVHPAPQTCSYHVLSYRASPLKRSAHWKDAHATPVISDCTFVPILIQLLWPRFGKMVSECSLFSTFLCLILTYLAGCEQIQSLHRLLLGCLDIIPPSSSKSQTCSPRQSLTHCWQQKGSKNIPAATSSRFLSSALSSGRNAISLLEHGNACTHSLGLDGIPFVASENPCQKR